LKIKSNESLVKKIEEYIDKNLIEHVSQIRKLLEELKQESIEMVNLQLSKFREVNQMG
jgi:hypothetical protein